MLQTYILSSIKNLLLIKKEKRKKKIKDEKEIMPWTIASKEFSALDAKWNGTGLRSFLNTDK